MDGSVALDGLDLLLSGAGLEPGPSSSVVDGVRCVPLVKDGEPVALAIVEGGCTDPGIIRRLAWSSGCPAALVSRCDGIEWVPTASSPVEGPAPLARTLGLERLPSCLTGLAPSPVPGVVRTLVELMDGWRARFFRRALAERTDWTEEALSLAVEAPIVDLLLGGGETVPAHGRMQAELDRAGFVLPLVPPGLLALAWDRHLCRGVRLRGGESTIVTIRDCGPGPDRAVLSRFARWAGECPGGVRRVLVPACGAGRLLLLIGEWAAAHGVHLYGIDPDPRAVLFASRLLDRVLGGRAAWAVRAASPLVDLDFDENPINRLVPADARVRLRATDWETLFGGVRLFDRVLIGDPVFTMTRRPEVRRYLEERYATAGPGADPALLLAEAGARHLAEAGRVFALYRATALRAGRAAPLRRWLAPRAEASMASSDSEYIAVRATPHPIRGPIEAGSLGSSPIPRSYPRSALNIDGWTIRDPAAAALRDRLEAGSAPLGEALLGGIGPAAPVEIDPDSLVGADDRRRMLRADRRAARVLFPVVGPEDVVPYSTAEDAARFLLVGPLPTRARRIARELGVVRRVAPLPFPSAGPRLLFVEGAGAPAFLCDRGGRALARPGIGELRPASSYLVGLLHSAPIAGLLATRCPGGITSRCLSRLPVRLPDPYDPREQAVRDRVTSLVRERLAENRATTPGSAIRRRELESAIDLAVRELYFPSPGRVTAGDGPDTAL